MLFLAWKGYQQKDKVLYCITEIQKLDKLLLMNGFNVGDLNFVYVWFQFLSGQNWFLKAVELILSCLKDLKENWFCL